MAELPTDLEILDVIYDRYYETFASYSKDNPTRATKVFVPIDITAIARSFGVDDDIIFGRLYYHLDKKHGYKDESGNTVHAFYSFSGPEGHSVNFPLVSSILADLRREDRQYRIATG